MKHQIIVRYSNRADRSLPLTLHLRKCIAAARGIRPTAASIPMP